MRLGRVIAFASGAALAGFGVMQLKRARASDREMAGMPDPAVDLRSPASSDSDQPELSPVGD